MQPATYIALTISFLTLIGLIIDSVITAKTYKKTRRLEFLQRRDHLFQKISDLNDRNTEAQFISSGYKLVAVKKAGLPLRGDQAEQNNELIASIREARDGIEKVIELWYEHIDRLHSIYGGLTSNSDAQTVEMVISIVNVASDDLKKYNSKSASNLHILETTDEFIKTTLAESEEKIRQINLDFERGIENLVFEHRS